MPSIACAAAGPTSWTAPPQIEHHLFPRLPRHAYGTVGPRVRAVCAAHGVRYEKLSLLGSTLLIVRHLQLMGQPKLA